MRILHAIHDFLPRHRAGSEIYCANLAGAQANLGHEVTVLAAEYDPGRQHASLLWRRHGDLPVVEVINNWAFSQARDAWSSPRLEVALASVLDALSPEVLHLHSLLNLPLRLPELARERGIPVVMILHDFTMVCPSGGQRIHWADDHLCQEIDAERCADCFSRSVFARQMAFGAIGGASAGPTGTALRRVARGLLRKFPRLLDQAASKAAAVAAPRVSSADIEERMRLVAEAWQAIDRVIAPSAALAEDFVRFGLPEDKLEVSDYGFPTFEVERNQPGEGPLRIGYVGTLVQHKGVHILLEALRELPLEGWSAEIHGDLETFPDYTAELKGRASDLPVRFVGRFDDSGKAAVYRGLDVLVVPSLWPENSPLVIHEAFQAGLPVVGSDLGGTVGLVEHEVSGLIYRAHDPGDLARSLGRLLEDPALRRRLAEGRPTVKSVGEDAEQWVERYREALR